MILRAGQVPVQHATQEMVIVGREAQDPVVKAHLIVHILLRFHKHLEEIILEQKVGAFKRLNQAFLNVNRTQEA